MNPAVSKKNGRKARFEKGPDIGKGGRIPFSNIWMFWGRSG